jgi:hypothetical protein
LNRRGASGNKLRMTLGLPVYVQISPPPIRITSTSNTKQYERRVQGSETSWWGSDSSTTSKTLSIPDNEYRTIQLSKRRDTATSRPRTPGNNSHGNHSQIQPLNLSHIATHSKPYDGTNSQSKKSVLTSLTAVPLCHAQTTPAPVTYTSSPSRVSVQD